MGLLYDFYLGLSLSEDRDAAEQNSTVRTPEAEAEEERRLWISCLL
ncbi:hypothetical protein [Arcticibacter sp. MXS-1]